MTRILVTGGAGYIGSHTCQALSEANHLPVVLDDLSTGHRSHVKWGPLVEGDIRDAALVARTIAKYRIEAVIHFAASAYVGDSMRFPREYFQNNVVGSLALLDAILHAGVRNVVFSSTCASYGHPQTLPIDESHRQLPVNPYGDSKLFIEKALAWYGSAYGMRSVCLRYFNAAGADPTGTIGERHEPETHLIPLAIGAAMGTRPNVTIFGGDYETPDGTAVRDYIHVCDLADAHLRALSYLMNGGESTAVNLGTGRGHSVRDVMASVSRVTGTVVPVTEAPRREGDPAELVADAAKARALLGWKPRFTSLDDIIRTAYAWHCLDEPSDANGLQEPSFMSANSSRA